MYLHYGLKPYPKISNLKLKNYKIFGMKKIFLIFPLFKTIWILLKLKTITIYKYKSLTTLNTSQLY